MEYQGFVPIVVLKVRDICCKEYQKKLQKELFKLDGVYAIDINPEKNLVSVRGKVDPDLLLNTILRTDKYAEILCSDNNNTSTSQNNRHYCPKENNNNGHKVEEKEEEHICEDYVPPPIDERVCRDYYCRSHRMRPCFRDRVPGSGYYAGSFGQFPQRGARRPTMYDPRWFMEAPPPPGYGYYSGRQMPGFGSYGSFGYESGGNCIIM